MERQSWEEKKYDDTFEETYEFLKRSLEDDPNYTVENLKGFLETLYIQEGNDQLGRGEVRDISIYAQIAACETILTEYNNGKLG
ncbi:hypothetical protein NRP93_000358 [Clostridium botulinum]|nr:hypothetical protein [Clostridium botulinum]